MADCTPRPARLSMVMAALAVVLSGQARANHVFMPAGPFGGMVVSIAVSAQEPPVLYVAAFGVGIWKSGDGGSAWQQVNRGLTSQRVLAVHLPDGRGDWVLAGTDAGVFLSRNGGRSWAAASGNIAERNVRAFASDPALRRVLYAASDAGVFRSADGGRTWKPASQGLGHLDVRGIVLDPSRPETLWAATFGGVFMSEDGGRTWTAASHGLTDLRVRTAAPDPDRRHVLYAGTARGGLFVSEDGGRRWRTTAGALGPGTGILAVVAGEAGQRFAGTVAGLARSVDWGRHWDFLDHEQTNVTISALAAGRGRHGALFVGTGGRLYTSGDGGATWAEIAPGTPPSHTQPGDARTEQHGGVLSRQNRRR